MHGGRQQAAPPGSPVRPGRPPTSFVYATLLNLPGDADVIELAREKLGLLDDEILLVRRNLYRAQERLEQQPRGGVPTSVGAGGTSITVETHQGHIVKILAELRKLELARQQLRGKGEEGIGALDEYLERLRAGDPTVVQDD